MPVGLSRFHQSLSMPKTKALAKPWSGADRTCNRVRVKDGSWELNALWSLSEREKLRRDTHYDLICTGKGVI